MSDSQPEALLALIARRRSVRAYQARPLERDRVLRILEAARAAPSAGNLQAYEIVVCEDAARRRALAQASLDQLQVAQAPTVLVFFADPERAVGRYGRRGGLYAIQDATIACTHAMLAAAAFGIGSCWIGAFHKERVVELCGAGGPLEPIALLCLGYPDERPLATERRPLDALVHWEQLSACSVRSGARPPFPER
jgi:nitroreductase